MFQVEGKKIGVVPSTDQTTLFFGNLPKGQSLQLPFFEVLFNWHYDIFLLKEKHKEHANQMCSVGADCLFLHVEHFSFCHLT